MLKWESDLGVSFSVDEWTSMSDNLRKSNKAISFRETPIKIFSRWYLTPSKLHTYYPSISPNCFRGCAEPGTLMHTFWNCIHLNQIWHKATDIIENSSKQKIIPTPQICLLFANIPNIPSPCMRLFHSLCSSSHWMIAYNWKSNNLPWQQVVTRMESLKLSKWIYHTLNDSTHIHKRKWSYWNPS